MIRSSTLCHLERLKLHPWALKPCVTKWLAPCVFVPFYVSLWIALSLKVTTGYGKTTQVWRHLRQFGMANSICVCVVDRVKVFYLCSSAMTQHFCCFNRPLSLCVCVIFSHLAPSIDLSKGLTVQLSNRRHPTWLTDPVENVFFFFSGCAICTVLCISGETSAGEKFNQRVREGILQLRRLYFICTFVLYLCMFYFYTYHLIGSFLLLFFFFFVKMTSLFCSLYIWNNKPLLCYKVNFPVSFLNVFLAWSNSKIQNDLSI